MIDLDNLKNNLLVRRWKARYEQLPETIKRKLEEYDDDRQLKVIKKQRIYPETGDIFRLISSYDLEITGIVIRNHVNNINGEELLVVAFLKYGFDYRKAISEGLSSSNLILPPQVVGKEYWSKGYFYNYDHYNENIMIDTYGFYDIVTGKLYDEYGQMVMKEPELLGSYAVATINGISQKLDQELIIGMNV